MIQFPKSEKIWTNLLTDKILSHDEIEEVEKCYKACNASNMYDYWVYYLHFDVQILLQAINRYRDFFWKIDKIDFILYKKLTISSLMFTMGYSVNLMDKPFHIAPFRIQNSVYNEMVSNSKIGTLIYI